MALPAIQICQDLRSDSSTGLACIVDVETTGLYANDETIELGLVLFAFTREYGSILGVVDEYVGFREPTVPISPRAQEVHGISLKQLRGQRLDYNRVETIFTQAEFLIAHNVGFDRRFVSRLSETATNKPWLCTMAGINWPAKGCPSRKLQDLLRVFQVKTPGAHRALEDVYGVLHLLAVS